MKKQIFLHIGTLKTGSTSLQRFLLDHADYLSTRGYALYRGEFQEANHRELHLAAMRYERDSLAKLGRCRNLRIDADFTHRVADRVRAFLATTHEPRVIFTAEGLSWLRFDDEVDRLRTILDLDRHEAKVLLYLRNKEDFLRSYTSQLYKVAGRQPSRDRESVLYVEPDTWLTDFETLVAVYRRGFGRENVVVIDYDLVMRDEGNVIPSFLRALGLDASEEVDTREYFCNVTKPATADTKRSWFPWTRRRAG